MQSDPIAIIGMACHYPGAKDLRLFWENILTKRRQFRRIPDSRLPAADYYDSDPSAPDKTYCDKAGLIDGFSFDRVRHRIPRSSFDSTDIVHWLALKVALESLEDAGFSKDSVPTERSGVILGNTLTGEHSRSEGLRLRWPFVRRVLQTAAQEKDLSSDQIADLLKTTEKYYKSVFAPVTEDTLAGALSNTISGRICNHLDFHGGGYTVDGACSSSVIAAATAATALNNGDLDLALAGGVDISLDTLELVGFAKTAALTKSDMRVYDRRADGFIPGEGCGFVVMKRLRDAVADGNYIYAVLRGWGISSDGKGGLTAPNAEGQARALRRAYERADWNINDLDFIEGHGTGTAVGDKAELEAVALAMSGRQAEEGSRRCGITSLKSIIGHTKAASGIGALIKAVIAVNRRVLPPVANCSEPNPVFTDKATALYPILSGEIRPQHEKIRAGISGMGFGGINCHLAIESGDAPSPKLMPAIQEQKLLAAHQSTELFIFSASTISELQIRIQKSRNISQGLSEGELVDLASHLMNQDKKDGSFDAVRAAILAESPEALLENLAQVEKILQDSPPEAQQTFIDTRQGICIGNDAHHHRVGFLFPGQGSQQLNMSRQLVLRHDWAQDIVTAVEEELAWPTAKKLTHCIFKTVEKAADTSQVNSWRERLKQTETAQPAICLASILWLEKLTRLGIKPDAVGGHSLGELTAFHAAGAYSREDLIKFAAFRGHAMAPGSNDAGIMASLACSAKTARAILDKTDGYAVAANKNSPSQTVISGETSGVEQACALAEEQGITTRFLPVANAFHSKFVARAAQQLAEARLIPEKLPGSLTAALFSGITGREINAALDFDPIRHFSDQVISPVDFVALVQGMRSKCDLMVEVGPGRVLSGLANAINATDTSKAGDKPLCFPVETKPGRDSDLNLFLAVYFVHGGSVKWRALYDDRLVRPFKPVSERVFLTNPCERPFPVQLAQPEQPARSASIPQGASPEHAGQTDFLLAETAGISPETLSAYLAERSKFLGGVIKVDIDSMSIDNHQEGATESSTEPAGNTSTRTVQADKAEQRGKGKNTPTEEIAVSTLLFALIEQRTGFPQESLSLEFRLLDDLNLDSIKASELIAEAATKAGVAAAEMDVAEYANATLSEIAETLEILKKEINQGTADTEKQVPSKYPTWVCDFTISYTPEPLPETKDATAKHPDSRQYETTLILYEQTEQDLAEHLDRHLSAFSATVECALFEDVRKTTNSFATRFTTVIALLPRPSAGGTINKATDNKNVEEHVVRLHTLLSNRFHNDELQNNNDHNALAIVQFGGGFFGTKPPVTANIEHCSSKALAASLHLEQPDLKVRVLDFYPQIAPDQLCVRIITELSTTDRYSAVGYDADLIRRLPRPVLRNTAEYAPRQISWSEKDVVLVTGGAKGITAECAFTFARAAQVRMALVGSSQAPDLNDQHNEIARTLKRFKEAGLSAYYYQCDVTDADAVTQLVRQVCDSQGDITGLIHGSALNRPGELDSVSVRQALHETAPKLSGAINLCAALQDTPPKLFVVFSSITGISGMIRNGWYGFSNEAMHLVAQQYGETFPQTAVLSIAFSIWNEVGMGIRMGSTAWLGKIGVDAIPVQQGTAHFLHLITHDPGDSLVVVTARTSELDTFAPYPPHVPENLQFLEKITTYSPGIEIISRARLTLERDPYIKDHTWRGTYLFPMVFGLEAMAQAVRAVTGITCFDSVCIENIALSRPITLPDDAAIEIEIHAQVLEQNDKQADPRVEVQIRAEQTDFTADHFSATFVLTADRPLEREEIPTQCIPLDISPSLDLYNEKLLFQGPLFQRIQKIFRLDSQQCIFQAAPYPDSSEMQSPSWQIGDPFFRDSLLQSEQLPVPKELCLPRSIERIERYPVDIKKNELLWGKTVIERHSEQNVYGTVTVYNSKGQIIERIKGYLSQIIEHRENHPTAEEFVLPGKRDRAIIQKEIMRRSTSVHFIPPVFSSDFIPNLKLLSKQERRKKEASLLKNIANRLLNTPEDISEVAWSDTGKPYIAVPSDTGINISLAHNEGTVICTAGQGPQGCDLETVSVRSRDAWIALLGSGNDLLLDQLIKRGDSLNRAGTRIWAVSEAVFKVSGTRHELAIQQHDSDTVLFKCDTDHTTCHIITFPTTLTRRDERMLAIAGQTDNNISREAQKTPVFNETYPWSNDGVNFTHEFTTTFFNSRGSGGKVYFTNIPIWMGKLRELALSPISDQLLKDMNSRQWGMVTNMSSFSIKRHLDTYDTVIEKVRLMDDTDLTNSIISLAFEWSRKQEDGTLVKVASGKLLTTWVSIEGHGVVKKAPLPKYLSEYLADLPPIFGDNPQWLNEKRLRTSKMVSVSASDIANRKQYLLDRQLFLTSTEDSNLVGNIYFSNYYSWQARIRDHYLFTLLPDIFQQHDKGEFSCVHAEVCHLQEAMPFDTIEVSMYMQELFEEGFTLYFEYYSISKQGKKRKLAHGVHTAIWTSGVLQETTIRPMKMPKVFLTNFKMILNKQEAAV